VIIADGSPGEIQTNAKVIEAYLGEPMDPSELTGGKTDNGAAHR